MVGWIAQSRINCRIKLKIHGTMFLYSKEEQIMTSIGLLEIELVYDQGQDTIAVRSTVWSTYIVLARCQS